MIHKTARWLGHKLCPDIWNSLVVWKSARADLRFWKERAKIVQQCPDNERIHRVPGAGSVRNGIQTMHNGIQVLADSYYGKGGTHLIRDNRGCHEPQEEVVFDAIIQTLAPGSKMIELGAYWGYYSLWFSSTVTDAHVLLVEPEEANLGMGKKNFEINNRQGNFVQAYVGSSNGVTPNGERIATVDSLVNEESLERIQILHSDIQGFELDMLKGAIGLLSEHRVDYVFISTHSTELHDECEKFLSLTGYRTLVSITPADSYSVDGILVAFSPFISPPDFEIPSKRKAATI